ncbi:GNAT family N-acetyltransferase, partial [bacterium]|nr:GNAT family N-acetyltransferase [bacterium]
MSEVPEYGPILDEEELDLHARNMGWSFRAPAERVRESFRRVGEEHVRILRKNGRAIGGLTLYPLSQWIGGRSLPMTGVNLVGIVPEHRGGGTATVLMEAAVRDMHASGVPISVLYPAKQTLYRRAGFELAGSRFENEVSLRDLEFGRERDLPVRAYEPADRPAIRELHRAVSRHHTGPVDRPEFFWDRIADPPGDREIRGYVVEGDAGCEGYAFVEEVPTEGYHYRLVLTDFLAATERAAKRLLRFFGDHATLAERVNWFGDPTDLAFLTMREQTWRTKISFRWMLRILDPVAALEQRGYPAGLSAELPLHLTDPLLPRNDGPLRVEVEGGRARVTRGGSGAVRADVRGLAAIYTGYLSPWQAKAAGLLDG